MGNIKNFAGYPTMYDAHVAMEQKGIFGGTLSAAAMSVDEFTGIPKNISAASVVGRGSQTVASGAIEPAEPVLGAALSGRITPREAIAAIKEAPKPIQRAASAAVNNPYMVFMRAFSEDSERFLRASTFISGVRQYGTSESGKEMASLLTKASQFDYTDLAPSEQRVMKLISPFFVWTKNNVPLQFRNLFASPGKVNAILKLQQNVEKQFRDPEDEMEEYMPQWLREQLGFASVYQPGGDRLAMGLNLPLADLNRFFEVPVTEEGGLDIMRTPRAPLRFIQSALTGAGEEAVGSASPFVKFPIETVTGVNLFTGAKFGTQAAGPVYRVASRLPILADTYTNPETGEVRASSYAINQFRNLLPQLGQIDRLLPFGQQGDQKTRIAGNWISQASSFLPVTVSATLTESQYAGELRTRNLKLEEQIRQYERANGLPEGSLRETYNEQQKSLAKRARDRGLAAALAPG